MYIVGEGKNAIGMGWLSAWPKCVVESVIGAEWVRVMPPRLLWLLQGWQYLWALANYGEVKVYSWQTVVGEQMEIYFWNVQKDPLMLLLTCSIKLSEKKLVPPPDDAPKYCSGWLLELLTELTRKRWKWLWIRQSARSNLHFSPKTLNHRVAVG